VWPLRQFPGKNHDSEGKCIKLLNTVYLDSARRGSDHQRGNEDQALLKKSR
jgi:hypothetical protein